MIGPLLTSYGVLTIGWPGVGKTPLLIVLSLALGHHHIRPLELEAVLPAWRRAKGIDHFRRKTRQFQEGPILDDPSMEKIDAADLESWLAEEDQNCSSRYSVRLVRNGMRAVATSELLEEDEPRLEKEQTTITSNSSQITRKFSDSHRRAYVMAIWKRCMVLIFGKRAFYLRLPSQEEASPIPCTQEDDLHVDLFTDHDKPHMPGIRWASTLRRRHRSGAESHGGRNAATASRRSAPDVSSGCQ